MAENLFLNFTGANYCSLPYYIVWCEAPIVSLGQIQQISVGSNMGEVDHFSLSQPYFVIWTDKTVYLYILDHITLLL